MKQLLTLLFFLAIIPFTIAQQGRFELPKNLTTEDYDQHRIILKLTNGSSSFSTEQLLLLKQFGLQNPQPFINQKALTNSEASKHKKLNSKGLSSIFTVSLDASSNLETVINQVRQLPWITYADPIYHHQLLINPDTLNEPFTNFHWGHINANVYHAWDSTKGDPNVVVGVIDAGCKTSHPSLVNNLYYNDAERFGVAGVDDDDNGYVDDSLGYDFADRDADVNVPTIGHGTEVVGVVGAALSDGFGTFGVAPSCKVMPINISLASGILVNGYEAIIYAAANGCDIINLSWGRVGNPTQAEQDIIDMVVTTYDVVIVAAAGNTAAKLDFYPASYDHVVSVAHIAFNNSGVATYSDFIDLSAPGVELPSTTVGGGIDGNGHSLVSGSSFASPFVASAIALLKSHYPDYKGPQLVELVRQTANPDIYNVPANIGKEDGFGKGRLDVLNAISSDINDFPAVKLLDYSFKNENDTALLLPTNTIICQTDFINYLAPTTADFKVTVSTENPNIILIDSVLDIGILATLDTLSDQIPFRFTVAPNATLPQDIIFKFVYEQSGFRDYEAVFLELSPTALSLTLNRISTTLDANGRIGFTGTSFNDDDIGVTLDGIQLLDSLDSMVSIGLLIAASPTTVLDCIENETGGLSNDFTPLEAATITTLNFDGITVENAFADLNAATPLGLHIRQSTRAWRTVGNTNYILISYQIENTSSTTYDSLHLGLFADWQLNDSLNAAQWDEEGQFGYLADDQLFAAIKAIGSTQRFRILDRNGAVEGADLSDGFSKAEKYALLTSNDQNTVLQEKDLAAMTSLSIFDFAPNDVQEVAFMMMADTSLQNLRDAADSLSTSLDNLYMPELPVITDSLFCDADAMKIRPDSAGDYRFYEDENLTNLVYAGREMPIALADTGKLFYVTNASLPLESQAIAISIHWAVSVADFTLPDSIDLANTNELLISNLSHHWPTNTYLWEFSDGTNATANVPQKSIYEMGNYNVKLITTAEQSGCLDSLSKSIVAYRSDYLPEANDLIVCKGDDITITPSKGSNFNFYQFADGTGLLGAGASFTLTDVTTPQHIYITTTDSVFESLPILLQVDVSEIVGDFTLSATNLNAFIGDTLYLAASSASTWTWDFDNGETSTIQSPYVIYDNVGDYTISLEVTNALNCRDVIQKSVSVFSEEPIWTDNELVENLLVYPNPSTGIVQLKFASNNYRAFSVSLITTTGKPMFSQIIDRSSGAIIPLNLQVVPKGLYLLKIDMHQASITKRIVLDNE